MPAAFLSLRKILDRSGICGNNPQPMNRLMHEPHARYSIRMKVGLSNKSDFPKNRSERRMAGDIIGIMSQISHFIFYPIHIRSVATDGTTSSARGAYA
jgi:hypothetical protein